MNDGFNWDADEPGSRLGGYSWAVDPDAKSVFNAGGSLNGNVGFGLRDNAGGGVSVSDVSKSGGVSEDRKGSGEINVNGDMRSHIGNDVLHKKSRFFDSLTDVKSEVKGLIGKPPV